MSRTKCLHVVSFQLLAFSSQLLAFSFQYLQDGQKTRPSVWDADPKNQPQPQRRRTRVSDPHRLNPLIAAWAMSAQTSGSNLALGLHRIGAGACPVGRAVLMTGSGAARRTFHALVRPGTAQDLPLVDGRLGDVGWAWPFIGV